MTILRKSNTYRAFEMFNYLLMAFIGFVCVAPVLHVIFSSVSDPIRLTAHTGILLWPLGFTLRGFEIIFSRDTILMGYMNTLINMLLGVSLSISLTAIGGYALSRKGVLFSNPIMFFITFTMLFSGGLIPWYMVVRGLGMINTRFAMFIPMTLSVFNLIIMRTALMQVPVSLEESAKLDGAGHFTIMFKIILPLAKATIAVILLFYSINMWNSWFPASIFIRDRALFPLQLVLREVLIANDVASVVGGADEAAHLLSLYRPLVRYATIVVATLPVLAFYPFAQKYFVTGVMIGSIKG